MSEADRYSFPECMHYLGEAMHRLNVDPAEVIISLPREKWWNLASAIERKYRDMFIHKDSPIYATEEFKWMGFRFVPRDK